MNKVIATEAIQKLIALYKTTVELLESAAEAEGFSAKRTLNGRADMLREVVKDLEGLWKK